MEHTIELCVINVNASVDKVLKVLIITVTMPLRRTGAETEHYRPAAWKTFIAITAASGVLALGGCTEVEGLQGDALIYNEDGTATQKFYIDDGRTLHHTRHKACVPHDDDFKYTVTTTYEPNFIPEGESNPTVESRYAANICDGGEILPNELGIPQSALTP